MPGAGRCRVVSCKKGSFKMPEENKTGTEQTGDADQKTGNNDVAADVQQGATQDAAGNQDEKIAGLTAAAVAEREKRQVAETDAQNLRDQMAMREQAQQPVQPEQPKGLYQAVAKQLGIDSELASPEEQGKIFNGMLQITSGQQSEQSFINSRPDYAEVVGVNGPGGQFQYAPPLLRALKGNPALASALNNSPNKAVLAYEIARQDPQYIVDVKEAAKSDDTKAAEKAKAAIDKKNTQLSISAAKGGAGTLDNAARRAGQNDAEFLAENEQIMAKAL